MKLKSLILFLSAIFVIGVVAAGCEQQPMEDPLGESPAHEAPGAHEEPLEDDLW